MRVSSATKDVESPDDNSLKPSPALMGKDLDDLPSITGFSGPTEKQNLRMPQENLKRRES